MRKWKKMFFRKKKKKRVMKDGVHDDNYVTEVVDVEGYSHVDQGRGTDGGGFVGFFLVHFECESE